MTIPLLHLSNSNFDDAPILPALGIFFANPGETDSLARYGALSCSVGRDNHFPEDGGFALEPWTSVSFDNAGLTRPNKSPGGVALAMGNYFFGRADGSELKT